MKNITLTHKLAALASTAMLLTNVLSAGIASATTATGTLSAGSQSAQSVGAIALTGAVSSSYQADGLATAADVNITFSDETGSGAGWRLKSSIDDNFNLDGASVTTVVYGSGTGTVSGVTGDYSADTCKSTWTAVGNIACGSMRVVVSAVNAGVPTGAYYWAANNATAIDATPYTNATGAVTSVAAGAITVGGLTIATATATWAVDDVIVVNVAYIPTAGTHFQRNTNTLAATTGDLDGLTLTNSGLDTPYTTVATAENEVVALPGHGGGNFNYDMSLKQNIYGNIMPGIYNSSMTFSVAAY